MLFIDHSRHLQLLNTSNSDDAVTHGAFSGYSELLLLVVNSVRRIRNVHNAIFMFPE
jgi:hypothetical protein